MKETLLGFDPSLTKTETNGADSDIKHAYSKNDTNSKNQNTALKKTLNIYSLDINGLLSHIDERYQDKIPLDNLPVQNPP